VGRADLAVSDKTQRPRCTSSTTTRASTCPPLEAAVLERQRRTSTCREPVPIRGQRQEPVQHRHLHPPRAPPGSGCASPATGTNSLGLLRSPRPTAPDRHPGRLQGGGPPRPTCPPASHTGTNKLGRRAGFCMLLDSTGERRASGRATGASGAKDGRRVPHNSAMTTGPAALAPRPRLDWLLPVRRRPYFDGAVDSFRIYSRAAERRRCVQTPPITGT
jgi:hypothetical protein